PRAGRARREAATEPLPLPRLRHARLEPAGHPPPHLGRAGPQVQVVGRAARSVVARPGVLGAARRRRAERAARRVRRRARRGARAAPGRHGGMTALASSAAPSPYKGLERYDEADALFFFGRDADAELVVANVLASRLTLLFGESGVGKSSLLHAG